MALAERGLSSLKQVQEAEGVEDPQVIFDLRLPDSLEHQIGIRHRHLSRMLNTAGIGSLRVVGVNGGIPQERAYIFGKGNNEIPLFYATQQYPRDEDLSAYNSATWPDLTLHVNSDAIAGQVATASVDPVAGWSDFIDVAVRTGVNVEGRRHLLGARTKYDTRDILILDAINSVTDGLLLAADPIKALVVAPATLAVTSIINNVATMQYLEQEQPETRGHRWSVIPGYPIDRAGALSLRSRRKVVRPLPKKKAP